jgi:TPR repeat protein
LGGHKNVCGKEGSSGDRSDGVPDTPLKHPCPVCLDTEDDAGEEPGMCYNCGQMVCDSCNRSFEQHATLVTRCPTCRAEGGASAEEDVRRLRQLLARPPGRHTAVAQCALGSCYSDGTGVVQDGAEAMRWLRLAAEQGYASAMYNLGSMYLSGSGVAKDDMEAARWYRLAADRGHVWSQCNLGDFYNAGTGVAQNKAEAARWYRLAADQGCARAQMEIENCYRIGTGAARDDAQAVRWYRLAADQGNVDAY